MESTGRPVGDNECLTALSDAFLLRRSVNWECLSSKQTFRMTVFVCQVNLSLLLPQFAGGSGRVQPPCPFYAESLRLRIAAKYPLRNGQPLRIKVVIDSLAQVCKGSVLAGLSCRCLVVRRSEASLMGCERLNQPVPSTGGLDSDRPLCSGSGHSVASIRLRP